ncbi:TetR-type HTH domain-containing protein [Gaiella occulta]|uniref:TetR-type HTH domain-containing protein n=1 Tax=Gaiella occulta TaxID=1002870 RepID=A0A7M2YYT0_9ACTN|nr:TetR/AcrR family transcriptional regulator [Gaiella occulta]RDI75315.1 TetR-type HTH domain-containing protein [Gaiella occulta]
MATSNARPRGALRRRAILEATLRVVGRDGAGALTHRAVAREAGVPLAATTYYFASKDDLVREAFAFAMAEDVAALQAESLLPTRGELTAGALAQRLTALMASRIGDDRATLLVQYALELEAARRSELTALSRAWTAAYVGAVAPALAALGSADPKLDAWIVVTALAGMELESLASGEVDAATALLPAVERLLVSLVG